MAEGPIPWTAVNSYCIRHGIWDDEFDIFVLIIKGVDAVYLEKRAAQHKKAMKKPSGGKSSARKIRSK